MPQDEPPDEERPRVYGTEDGDLGRPDKPDIVGDDKADVSRMADDEVVKTEPSTSAAHHHSSNKGTRTTANVQVPIFNGSLFGGGRNYKTAFNTVSPSYITVHPQAQMLQQFAAAQQYYNGLNGFWCTRAPFASPPVASLTSPSLSSPTYGAAVNGIGVYSSPHSWFSAFQLDAAAKAGFIYAPMVTAQMSPSFPSAMDQLHLRQMELAAFSARMESPFIPSPLHSPESGAPIVSLGTKVPVPSFTAVKLAMPNAAGGCSNAINAGLGLSPSYVHYPSHPNPLLSMRQILVPPVTTTVTGVAASSLLPPSFNGMSGCGNPIIIGGSMPTVTDCRQAAASTSDKPSSNVFGAATSSGVKRPLDANGHHHLSVRQNNGHQHNHNSVQAATSSTVQRHKDCSSSKKQHIKKPLNAFMLYMKEMRPSVMQEAGLKERQSAEINRILGRRWHSLTRDEQQKYYEMAKKERQEHLRKYPSWSARDNYAIHKKKKRKRDKAQDNLEAKKCRARFGLDQQLKWCKHCRRKKKCLWFKDGDGENSNDAADASPAAQVTSTSQDDFQLHSISVDSLSTCPSAINNSNNDSTVHQPLVTSTTTSKRRNNESGDVAVSKKASADARIDSDCEVDSDSDSSVGDEVTFSDDDFSERLTASPRSSSTTDDIRVDDPADQTPTVVNLVVDACAKGET